MPTLMTAAQSVPRELGVPVKSVNWVQLFAGQNLNGEPLLLVTMGQDADGFFVCDIDTRTGHCTRYPSGLPNANFPTAAYQSPRTGVLYVGSAYTGHLHRYDPNCPPAQRTLEDLGPIDPELCSFPCRMDEAADGSIWIGAYGGCSLTRFDPGSGAFARFGRMDEMDQYFYPLCGGDGTVAGVVKVCRLHVVALDPRTGERRAVGPVVEADAAGSSGLDPALLDLVRGEDGLLYIKSPRGWFRLRGLEAQPIDQPPPLAWQSGPPGPQDGRGTLPDGSRAAFVDRDATQFRRIRITPPSAEPREITLDWTAQGTNLFLAHGGPAGKVYGSSWMPEHLFVYDPRRPVRDDNPKDLGQCSVSIGDAYSMGNFDGKLYIASYPGGRLSIYDPSRPYRFGEDESANPRDLGRVDQVAYRPRSMLCGPAGKVWVASIPDYGMWGGTLAWYDPASGAFGSHRHLIRDCSPYTLAWLPDLGQILVGLSVSGGSGTTPRATEAGFVLWDPVRDEAAWSGTMGLAAVMSVFAMCRATDGSIYAIVHFEEPAEDLGPGRKRDIAELARLDMRQRRALERSRYGDEGWPLDVSLQLGPDGAVYGATALGVYRITPGSVERERVWTLPEGDEENYVRAPGPIIGRTFYYGAKHRLRAVDLP